MMTSRGAGEKINILKLISCASASAARGRSLQGGPQVMHPFQFRSLRCACLQSDWFWSSGLRHGSASGICGNVRATLTVRRSHADWRAKG
eukprot:9816085-Lingulodinium_polyedra.AAC.2